MEARRTRLVRGTQLVRGAHLVRGALVRAAVLAAVAVVIAGTGCASGGPAGPPAPYAEAPAFTAGARLHLPGGQVSLAAPASAPPNGWLAPVSVPSPDGRHVIYRTWTARPCGIGRPALRLRHLASDGDAVFADGAASLAWGGDGRIGYAAGGDDRPEAPWTGRIMVRPSLSGPDQAWTPDPRGYVVAAWAGPHLLGYLLDTPGRPRLLAFDGPGRVRPLGPGVLVAVAPDGRAAFVADTADTDDPHVRIVEVATGTTRARLDLSGTGIAGVEHAGDWAGDRVVAAGVPGPVVFRVGPDTIRVEARPRLDPLAHPYGLREPSLAGDTVIAWAATDDGQDPPTALVRCPVTGGEAGCRAGPTYPPPAAHPVRNPSRPRPRYSASSQPRTPPARDAVSEKVTAFTAGGDDHVTKPFSVEELVARIRAVLRRTAPVRAAGPLLADGVSRWLRR